MKTNERVMISAEFSLTEADALNRIVKKTGRTRSDIIRIMVLSTLSEENLDWCIQYAKSKGVDLWTWINIVLSTFKENAVMHDEKRKFNALTLGKN